MIHRLLIAAVRMVWNILVWNVVWNALDKIGQRISKAFKFRRA